MDNDLVNANSSDLFEPMVARLEEYGPLQTFNWLIDLLAQQRPYLRSSNSYLVAYTGCPEAIEWLEQNVATPVTTHWGEAAALLGTPWPRIKSWLKSTRPRQIMALDTLYSYRLPAPNMAPLAQIAGPVLVDAPVKSEFKAILINTLEAGGNPRMHQTVDRIMVHISEILSPRQRCVPIEDLPLLFMQPYGFPNAVEIMGQHEAVITDIRKSLQHIIKDSKS